jgi:hypothetical protein
MGQKQPSRAPEPRGRESSKAWPLQSTKCNHPFAAPGNSKGSGDSLARILLANIFFQTGVLAIIRRLLKKRSDENRRLEKYSQVFVS